MQKKIYDTIKKFNMLRDGEKVCVALSGGADSVCLLTALKMLDYDVCAVHVNHHLRDEESDGDMLFCQNLCRDMDVKLDVYHVNVVEYAEKFDLSTETAARELRYKIFEKYNETAKIATAHNLNDCLETAIFNIARGTGIKGLCGVPPVRGNIVRPLVEISRDEIENFLKEQNQTFVTDSTNLQNDYARNKIRHFVLPQLGSINSNYLENYKTCRQNLWNDMNFLKTLAKDCFNNSKNDTTDSYDLTCVLTQPDAVKHRVFREILKENQVETSFDKINRLEKICLHNGKLNVRKDLFFTAQNGILKVEKTLPKFEKIKILFRNVGEYDFLNRKINFSFIEYDKIHRNFTKNLLDYGKIKGTLFLRNRQSGDKITLCSRNFTSSVKKLFNEKYPQNLRDNRLLLCDDDGVVFVEGFGCADRVKIDSFTQKILEIHLDNN